MEVGGQSGWTGWKLEVSLGGQGGGWRSVWVDRVEVGGQSVGGQGGSWRSVCGWIGWKLEVNLWVDRVEVGGQSVGG